MLYMTNTIGALGMEKSKVLFICEHNSARSQMSEELLRKMAGDRFEVESAGLAPGEINPLVIEVMKEEDVDLNAKTTQDVFDLFKSGNLYEYVVTVCDPTVSDRCPIFPGIVKRLNWPFPDPSKFEGPDESKLSKVRDLKEEIKKKIMEFVQTETS
jgi:arsenate reductase (thioredoxin)